MQLDSYLLFFFSALGVFNGFLLAVYFLFVARPWHISNGFMGALLLSLCTRVGKSIFFYFNDDLAGIYIQIGITACFFIGPFLFFYIHSLLHPEGRIVRQWKYYLFALLLIIIPLGILFPYRENLTLWRHGFMSGIYLQWLVFLIATGKIMYPYLMKIIQKNRKLSVMELWMCNVYIGTCLIWLAYNTCNFTSYISGAITFSFITYLLVLWYVFNRKKKSILFLDNLKQEKRKLSESRATKLLLELKTLMQEKAPYKNPKLKSEDLAKKLHISVHELSTLLNDKLGKRFSDFVNEYRVQFAIEIMETNHHYTLEAIGYEAGFNSKSTFYTAFKKIMGATPARYMKDRKMSPDL